MIGKNLFQLIIVLFSLFFFSAYSGFTQENIDINNIQSINVDELSDEQIQKFIVEIENRGLSESQLEILAKTRGVSSLQIQKLKQRISQVKSSTPNNVGVDKINRTRDDESVLNEIEVGQDGLFSLLATEEEEIEPQETIFGMDMFQSENLSFQPSANVPTPKNYQLGAGDQIIIDVWGASEQSYQLTISPEGSVRIPNLGPVYLSGLSVQEADSKIKSKLRRIYSGLGNNTYADISLGQIKSIRVNIIGEVKKQGTYTISPFSNIFNALYFAGGPNENGSLRVIDHYRNGKKLATIDVYDFLFNGVLSDESLNDQDLIIVRSFDKRVQITGEVKRQGYYEMKDGESLSDLLKYAAGFTSKAYANNISLKRNKDLNRSVETVASEDFNDFELEMGDEVKVEAITGRFENRVQISGAVNKQGEFEYIKGMKLSELFSLAEGIREDAFFERGVILRLKEDMTLEAISFNINDVKNSEDIALQNEDFIIVKSKFELEDQLQVNIQGEVRNPGDYPFLQSMTVEDLIVQAKGFKVTAARSIVEVARRKLYDDNSDPTTSAKIFNFQISDDLSLSENASDFKLEPFDLVIIRKSPNYEIQATVEVQGEANFPGKYVIQKKDERISDLLKRAGGVTKYGYVKGATLTRRTEYFSEESSEAAKLRRENLTELAERDTLLDANAIEIKRQESIGINLGEIIKNPKSKFDLILKEGDVLGIPNQLQTVRLRGELLYPSTVRFDNTLSFKGYISQAGGFADRANRKKSYVLYANGSVNRTKTFFWWKFYPGLEPGAEIIVPEKPEKRKITPGEILGLTTGVATFGLIILRIVDFIEARSEDTP